MGHKTQYHPLSLNTIRGALENFGVRTGRIQQLRSNFELSTASYRVGVASIPSVARKFTAQQLLTSFDGCFSADAHVTSISVDYSSKTRKQNVTLYIDIDLNQLYQYSEPQKIEPQMENLEAAPVNEEFRANTMEWLA
jgi:hypothetical protein